MDGKALPWERHGLEDDAMPPGFGVKFIFKTAGGVGEGLLRN